MLRRLRCLLPLCSAQRALRRGLLALRLAASLLAVLLLGRLLALLLAALLLALELGALLLTALLGGLLALLLTALLGGLLVLLLTALLLGGLLALLLTALLLALELGALLALLLGGLRALLLGGLRALLLGALLLAGLLLSRLQQRAEDLLGPPQVLLDVRAHLHEVGPEVHALRLLDERLVEDLDGATVQGDLGPDERHVELCAFLLLQRLARLDRVVLELLALRAGLDAGGGAPRQPDPVLLSPRVLVDHRLGEALHLRGLGLLQRDLRQLHLLPVDDRDKRRELLLRHLPHRAVTSGLRAAALAAALVAGLLAARLLRAPLSAAALAAALVAGLLAALAAALVAALAAALLATLAAALPAGLFAAALPAAGAALTIPVRLAAAPAVSVRVVTAAALAAGRRLAVRLGLIRTGDAPANPREHKAPREHDRHEAT
ncbi:hypothetical protein WMF42_01260 [Sorangium sp. So ce176]